MSKRDREQVVTMMILRGKVWILAIFVGLFLWMSTPGGTNPAALAYPPKAVSKSNDRVNKKNDYFLFTRTPNNDVRVFRLFGDESSQSVSLQPVQEILSTRGLKLIRLNWRQLKEMEGRYAELAFQDRSESELRFQFNRLFRSTRQQMNQLNVTIDGKSPDQHYQEQEDRYVRQLKDRIKSAEKYRPTSNDFLILTEFDAENATVRRKKVPDWLNELVARHLKNIIQLNRPYTPKEVEAMERRAPTIQAELKSIRSNGYRISSPHNEAQELELLLELEMLRAQMELGRAEKIEVTSSTGKSSKK